MREASQIWNHGVFYNRGEADYSEKVIIPDPSTLPLKISYFSSNLRHRQTTSQDWSVHGLASLSHKCNDLQVTEEKGRRRGHQNDKNDQIYGQISPNFPFQVPAASVQIMSAVALRVSQQCHHT